MAKSCVMQITIANKQAIALCNVAEALLHRLSDVLTDAEETLFLIKKGKIKDKNRYGTIYNALSKIDFGLESLGDLSEITHHYPRHRIDLMVLSANKHRTYGKHNGAKRVLWVALKRLNYAMYDIRRRRYELEGKTFPI